ncbi:uncharacterized protein LOC106170767 [Lingula anatina]|uniref:Large ribosomal subunit protein eL28 n=1 Tax=Lingula anatina TaxID=7574 RepID=A0A1S3J740_LINAN|nr:uncharacterized protein LOC106170767 [Lingula anatina]|eukprot:XP_013406215.1 uncharacterized protein LOC106170767 [Lingula anatina]
MSYEKFEGFFFEADEDKSGQIDIDELIKRLRRGGYKGTTEQIKRAFGEADTSGDGLISFEEYMTAMGFKLKLKHKGVALWRCLDEFDKERNWQIEYQSLPGIFFTSVKKYFTHDEMEKMIEVGDKVKNRSNMIDMAEYLRELAKLKIIELDDIPFPQAEVMEVVTSATTAGVGAAPSRKPAAKPAAKPSSKPKKKGSGPTESAAARAANNMSSHAAWLVIRNNSSFLIKRNGASFTREPNNLKNRNSFRYNGLIHRQTVGVEPAKDGKGVVLLTKNSKGFQKPSKSFNRVELKKGARRTMNTIRKTLSGGRYRKELTMDAMRRASAILKSQQPRVTKQTRQKKK